MKFKFELEVSEDSLGKGETQEQLLLHAKEKIEKALAFTKAKEVRLLVQKLVAKQICTEDEMTKFILELAQEDAGLSGDDAEAKSEGDKSEAEIKKAPQSQTTTIHGEKPLFPVVEEDEEESDEIEEDVDEEESDDEIKEDVEKTAALHPPKPPAKKFPFKKKPMFAPPAPAVVEEDVEEITEEEESLEEEEITTEKAPEVPTIPAGPPSTPPSKFGGGVKRPPKGMTGFAKKASPFKKLPRFKKPGE